MREGQSNVLQRRTHHAKMHNVYLDLIVNLAAGSSTALDLMFVCEMITVTGEVEVEEFEGWQII